MMNYVLRQVPAAKHTEKAGATDPATGLIKKLYDGVKILGNGDLNKKLTVKAVRFTKNASEKIEKAGGKAEVI